MQVLSQISILGGKIRKSALVNSMAYRCQNSRKSNFATEPTHLPLRDFAQSWMQAVEQDLGVKLDWVAGAHYDTDQPHVQFLWSGRNLAGEPVRIDREYIGHGLRARAAELIDLYA
jgi:hypothetical protein